MHKSNYYNVFCKQFDRNEHFSPLELSSAAIKINTAGLNNLGLRLWSKIIVLSTMNNWQHVSVGDLEQNELFTKSKS